MPTQPCDQIATAARQTSPALIGRCALAGLTSFGIAVTAATAIEVTIEDDYSYPQRTDYDYGVGIQDIAFSDAHPDVGDIVLVTVDVHNFGLCRAAGAWGWYSSTGRSCWAEWDFDYATGKVVDIRYRCWDRDSVVDWRVELDGVHLADVSVPASENEESWKIVTLHDVPITAGPHTLFLGTYQMDWRPDYCIDWVEVGQLRIEAETYDRMGGNDPDPDLRGLGIYPAGVGLPTKSTELTVQIWEGDPLNGGTLLIETFVGDINTVIDSQHLFPGNTLEAHYIANGDKAAVRMNWIPEEAKTYDIHIVVDPHGKLTEIDETNNQASRQITVGCRGDVDGDGTVGQSDLGALLSSFGFSPGDPEFNPDADFDNDGDVDRDDLAVLLEAYGQPCS
ncbi:MAG: hypothetical protein KAS72_07720 [Phycisphaerales bacterium]|nr:hypothetical protein [Phycisphaerales bacterium]